MGMEKFSEWGRPTMPNARPLIATLLLGLWLAGSAWAAQASPAPAPQPEAPRSEKPTPKTTTDEAGADNAPASQQPKNTYLPYEEPGEPQAPSMGAVVARVVGSLALVVGLILVTMLALKRILGGAKSPTTSRKVSELVEATPLGGKRYLYLIRVADRLLVVGAGGDRLVLLSEIKDPEVLARVAALPRRSDFFELFRRTRLGEKPEAASQMSG